MRAHATLAKPANGWGSRTHAPQPYTASFLAGRSLGGRHRYAARGPRPGPMGLLLREQARDALLAARADRRIERRAAPRRLAPQAGRSRDSRGKPGLQRLEPLQDRKSVV